MKLSKAVQGMSVTLLALIVADGFWWHHLVPYSTLWAVNGPHVAVFAVLAAMNIAALVRHPNLPATAELAHLATAALAVIATVIGVYVTLMGASVPTLTFGEDRILILSGLSGGLALANAASLGRALYRPT